MPSCVDKVQNFVLPKSTVISFIQRLLQKHYRWLFSILLAIIIVSFVFTIGASPGIGRKERRGQAVKFYGVDLGDPKTVDKFVQDACTSAMLKLDPSIYYAEGLEYEVLARIFSLDLAKKVGIPLPSDAWLKHYIETRPLFIDEAGHFDAKRYTTFQESIKNNPTYARRPVKRALLEDGMVDLIRASLTTGYVTPLEAKLHYTEQHATWDFDLITVSFDGFQAKIDPSAKVLREFYEAHQNEYAAPAKVTASYATFAADDFMKRVGTIAQADLKAFKENLKASKQSAEMSDEEVLQACRKAKARSLAERAANDFAYQLYKQKVPYGNLRFQSLLKAASGVLHKSTTYSEEVFPEELGLPESLWAQALQLDASKYYTDVERTEGGAAIVFVEKQIPSRTQSFEEAREKVTKDYHDVELKRRFEGHGVVVKRELVVAQKNGTLGALAQQKQWTFKSINGLCFANRPTEPHQNILATLIHLSPGEVSDGIWDGNALVFVALYRKVLPAVDKAAIDTSTQELKPIMHQMAERAVLNEAIHAGLQPKKK